MARFFRRLASFSLVIRFDRRGTGLSDRPSATGSSNVERWLDDCVAVLDAVGSAATTMVGMRSVEVSGCRQKWRTDGQDSPWSAHSAPKPVTVTPRFSRAV